jgi:hypothetical protein
MLGAIEEPDTVDLINEYEQDKNSEITKRARGKLVINAATVEQLVNRLAGARPVDGDYTRDFVSIYSRDSTGDHRFFCSPRNAWATNETMISQ